MERRTMRIEGFFQEYRFLSNFQLAEVIYEGETYPSTEHAYQAAKTLNLFDRVTIRNTIKPGDVKKIGNKITLREDWDKIKFGIMFDLVKQKFYNHPELKEKLLATGDAHLEETNWWRDTYWGVCNGVGENNLGKILMEVRSLLDIRETSNDE